MNILVTGGNGQLGLELLKNKSGKNNWLFLGHEDLDILDKEAVKEVITKNNIDVIINCAAFTNFDGCPNNKKLAFDVNSNGPKILGEALVETTNGLLIHISSDYVFSGEKRFGKYKADDKARPISTYGITKLLGEVYLINTDVFYLIFRVSWLYGGDKKNFVKTIYDRLSIEDEIKIVGDQVGTPTYVTDFAKFLVEILDKFSLDELKALTGTYHFTNKGKTSWYNLGKHIKKYREKYDENFTNKCKIVKIKTKDFKSNDRRPMYSPLSTKETEEVFGYKNRCWKEALKDCIIKYIKEK